MYARQELADGFGALGIRAGDTVMVHASVRAVGPIAGGPDQIHLALKDTVTTEGTVVMYASCPDHYDEVGLGSLDPTKERELLAKLPAFDARTARSARDNGTLVEFFRTWPDTRVNEHVVRFAAWGRGAEALVAPHPWNYAYGHGSVLERFLAQDGRILLIGSDHDQVTFLHYAEHVVPVEGKVVVRYRVPMPDGRGVTWREVEEFDTAGAAHPHWPDRFFGRLVDTHLARTGNRGGRVGDAPCYVMNARALHAFALHVMTAVAADPAAADEHLP